MSADPRVDAILDYWLGECGDVPPGPEARTRWFFANPEVDEEIRLKFGALVEAALAGELDAWGRAGGRERVALVILLDQFTRNLFRGDGRSYAGDPAALALTKATSAAEQAALHPLERYFLLIPWEHSEDLSDQEAGVEAFRRAAQEAPPAFTAFVSEAGDFAERHRAVIERFGRFPRRNAALGRTCTPEEEAYLAENPDGF
ncbi:MAG: DUF924 domain-containing protein [bacterium]|nr:DUF924 domain-containing protein [bacterium]